jgi:1-acyl-sn-glycerol-3-phosphate acyltransferase
MHAAFAVDVVDSGHVPLTGPAIIAANHRSFMDSIFLPLVLERPLSFLAKAEYFDNWRTAWFLRATGQIPVRRGSPGGAKEAFDAALAALDGGGLIGLYPEGTRSRDGLLHRGNLGAARLALATGAPIVPVGLIGTHAVQPPGTRLPRLGMRVEVRFGEPLMPDPTQPHRTQLRDLTRQLMTEIGGLCGQPLVPERALVAVS